MGTSAAIKKESDPSRGKVFIFAKKGGKLQVTQAFFSFIPPLIAKLRGDAHDHHFVGLAFRILVIGAGVAGLAAAKKVTWLEFNERFGELPGTPQTTRDSASRKKHNRNQKEFLMDRHQVYLRGWRV